MNRQLYKAIGLEFKALQDRVRSFIGAAHWQSDGEWKESIQRTVLRNYLPKNIEIGRGFILSNDETSTQQDIILFDTEFPAFHRDGDFVIVPADSVVGIVEVKTCVNRRQLSEALSKLACSAKIMRTINMHEATIAALFAFEQEGISDDVSDLYAESAANDPRKVVNLSALGDGMFVRFWDFDPTPNADSKRYDQWHCYELEKMAFAYFICNLIALLCPFTVVRTHNRWFPQESKEVNCLGSAALTSSEEGS